MCRGCIGHGYVCRGCIGHGYVCRGYMAMCVEDMHRPWLCV